jgi:hypothetical protein
VDIRNIIGSKKKEDGLVLRNKCKGINNTFLEVQWKFVTVIILVVRVR